jgi:hypothetical protein
MKGLIDRRVKPILQVKRIGFASLTVLTLTAAGCYSPAPAVAVQAPPPPPTGYVTYTPEYYAWDGYEYVGASGGQYVYWNGSAWLLAPPVILGRFHGWERYHPDWHRNAIHYHHEHEPYR